jgi:nitrate reductase gamma subunit
MNWYKMFWYGLYSMVIGGLIIIITVLAMSFTVMTSIEAKPVLDIGFIVVAIGFLIMGISGLLSKRIRHKMSEVSK